VAGDVRENLKAGPQDLVYRPFHQVFFPNLTLHVKTAGDATAAASLVAPIRAELARLDRNLPISRVSLLAEEMRQGSAQPLLFSQLLGSMSTVALLLTGIGLYATLAFAVRRRTREMGIRRALGARTLEVLELVLRRGLALTALGLAVGVAASLLATRALSGLLFGVTPTDPAVFLIVALICGSLGALASLLPAWSASRVDPMEALRQE
jgi:ABC-type antimicrobial peptide transport system permease subunit